MSRIGNRTARVCFAATLTLALTAPATCQEDAAKLHDLHVATSKGTTVWFTESSYNEQNLNIGDQKIKATFEVQRTFRISIKQVDAKGNRIVEIEVARVSGLLNVPGRPKQEFDTEADLEDQEAVNAGGISTWVNRLMASVGHPFITRIDANGKVSGSIEGVADEIRRRNAHSNVNASDLAETAFGRTPSKPKPIGGTWQFVQSGTDAMRVARHATMTLREVTEDRFAMDLSGTIEKGEPMARNPSGSKDTDATEARIAQMMKNMKIRDGKLLGAQVISRRDGLVLQTSSDSTFQANMTGIANQEMDTLIRTKLVRTTEPKLKAKGSWAKANQRRPATKGFSAEMDAVRATKCRTDVKMIADAVRMYYIKNSKLPASLKDLAKKDAKGRSLLMELPNDVWGNAFKLVLGDKPRDFEVVSAGPDGKLETDDDISSRKK